jgi:hypothetical protein
MFRSRLKSGLLLVLFLGSFAVGRPACADVWILWNPVTQEIYRAATNEAAWNLSQAWRAAGAADVYVYSEAAWAAEVAATGGGAAAGGEAAAGGGAAATGGGIVVSGGVMTTTVVVGGLIIATEIGAIGYYGVVAYGNGTSPGAFLGQTTGNYGYYFCQMYPWVPGC